ncbi:MAG TPA: SapB/AmfS family lanthipeptide [Nitrospiraceae bacterium]
MKKILKLQKLSSDKNNDTTTGGGGGSQASLLLCGDSSLSVTTCN